MWVLAGGIVGIILTGADKRMHRMYGVDLIGAAFGALCIVPALYLGPPWVLLPALGGIVILGATGCCRRWRRPSHGGAASFSPRGEPGAHPPLEGASALHPAGARLCSC